MLLARQEQIEEEKKSLARVYELNELFRDKLRWFRRTCFKSDKVNFACKKLLRMAVPRVECNLKRGNKRRAR